MGLAKYCLYLKAKLNRYAASASELNYSQYDTVYHAEISKEIIINFHDNFFLNH